MRKIYLFIIAFLSIVALTSCASVYRLVEWFELDDDFVFDTQTNVTINYWHRMGAIDQAMFVQWADEFGQLFPNISVNFHGISGTFDDLESAILFAIDNYDDTLLPDVMESLPHHIVAYLPSGRPVALNNLITHPNIGINAMSFSGDTINNWLDILPTFRQDAQYDNSATTRRTGYNFEYQISGTIMSLPLQKTTEILVYNRQLADEKNWTIPTTWEGWYELGTQILMHPDIIAKDRLLGPIAYDAELNWFINGAMQWGADYILCDDYGNMTEIERLAFNNQDTWAMTNFFRNMVQSNIMLTRQIGIPFWSSIFTRGDLFAYIGSIAGVWNAITEDAIVNGVVAGVAPMPHFEGKNRAQLVRGTNVSMFYNNDTHRLAAAWLFTQFITSAEKNAEFITAYNHPIAETIARSGLAIRHSTLTSAAFSNWQKQIVPFGHLTSEQISWQQLASLSIKQQQNRLVFDTIIMSYQAKDYYFTLPTLSYSEMLKIVGRTAFMQSIWIPGPDSDEVMAQIQQNFQWAYDTIVSLADINA